ncbi:hypothetical protein [Nocardia yamanashiensis]|uniref:hypothetical protein n=1 Tax=Nocardia yamanashiensis TaxID=209247 RepID=UPI0008349859|nr:hypothetical protein [Nocardia yamanashiensis]
MRRLALSFTAAALLTGLLATPAAAETPSGGTGSKSGPLGLPYLGSAVITGCTGLVSPNPGSNIPEYCKVLDSLFTGSV